ncbi:MAG: hypothetical protein O2814_03995 [Bacteroidetes bacterium]|nr:hypothetical protein [Bacteroidota bacterium]MDA1225072.1 hypothetical protein [Bacteroidota bacterium]
MPQYNHALCSYSIPKVKYTSAFNFVASYSDYEMIILPISFPQPIKNDKFDNAKNYSLSQIILNDEEVKNLPTVQYVFTLYSHENTVVYSKIITKENP